MPRPPPTPIGFPFVKQSPAPLSHPGEKNIVKHPAFSSTSNAPPPICLAKSKPKRRLSFDNLQSPAPLTHPVKKNIVKPPPPPIYLVKSKPRRRLSSDSLQSPAPLSHPGEKHPAFSPTSKAPPPPPPICLPFVKSMPKRRLSFDSLQSPTSLPHPGEKNIVKQPAFSLSPDAASLLTFHSDSEYDGVPDHLPMVPKDESASPKLGRSNTMTGTKRLTASSKWNNGWRFWKKNEEKGGELEIIKNPTSQVDLPLYQPNVGNRAMPPPPPPPVICSPFKFIKSKPKRRLSFDSLQSTASSTWVNGWVGKKNEEKGGDSEIHEKSPSPLDLPLYEAIMRGDLKSTPSHSTQNSQESRRSQNTHRTHKSQRTQVTQQSEFEVLKYDYDYRRQAPSPATIVITTRSKSVSEKEVPKEVPKAEPSLSPQSQPNVVISPEFSNTASEGPRLASSRSRGYESLSTSKKSEAAGASINTTGCNMFGGNFCIMGGSYYNVRGNAYFSSLFQASFGFKRLYRNISASAFHDSRARFPPPTCHPSTRKDIHAKIMEFITETPSLSKILYLFGSEGTGKSAIAQTIAEYCETNGILGASFFFSRVSSERNTDKNLVATLAYQLCVTIPELKPFIAKAVEDDLSMFQKDVDTQLEKLIINPIIQAIDGGKTFTYPIVIVIDGLDECEGTKEQCAFLRAISGAIGRYSLPLYFFIACRQEGHIVDWLNEDCTPYRIMDLDQNLIPTKRDIEAYICSEFERIRSVHRIPESLAWPNQTSIRMVVSKTSMLFSRASEIMAFIDQTNPVNQLDVFLRTSGSAW